MRTSFRVFAALAALLAAAPNARSEDESPAAEGPSAEVAPAAPTTPAPESGPAPEPEAAPQQEAPPGNWVYTQQYGWIWMPYAERYTWYPPDGYGSPYMFVYYPTFGWTWVVAPWVWGWGPWPYFGDYGPFPFAWYARGWWRHPTYWRFAPYRDYPFPVYRGVPLPRVRPAPAPAPARPGRVRPAPAPAPARTSGKRGR
jgi:hypothetical protein